jgi:hypothetical protein
VNASSSSSLSASAAAGGAARLRASLSAASRVGPSRVPSPSSFCLRFSSHALVDPFGTPPANTFLPAGQRRICCPGPLQTTHEVAHQFCSATPDCHMLSDAAVRARSRQREMAVRVFNADAHGHEIHPGHTITHYVPMSPFPSLVSLLSTCNAPHVRGQWTQRGASDVAGTATQTSGCERAAHMSHGSTASR